MGPSARTRRERSSAARRQRSRSRPQPTTMPSRSAARAAARSPATFIRSPRTPRSAPCTVVPDAGYNAAVRGTCGGTFFGATYVIAPVGADCTVVAVFAKKLVLFVGNSFTFGRVDPVMSYNTANVTDLTLAMWIAN